MIYRNALDYPDGCGDSFGLWRWYLIGFYKKNGVEVNPRCLKIVRDSSTVMELTKRELGIDSECLFDPTS